ncbi:hypothetical protein Pfo_023832 [Paulownia fortunei]|nr:hypothetical protein Pfo_023832 [Paulownia fortunei]
MLQILPQSVVLNYLVLITVQLKWAWDFLLYQSFFHPNGVGLLPEYVDDLNVMRYENDSESGESEECAVCLCDHLFHRACLDRWLGYGHMTCPLCRNNLRLPPVSAAELHQEMILISFCANRYSDRCAWWLR